MKYDEKLFISMKTGHFEIFIKNKISEFAFQELSQEKSTKSKLKDLQYYSLSPQKYIDVLSNKKSQLLANLRSRMVQILKTRIYWRYALMNPSPCGGT